MRTKKWLGHRFTLFENYCLPSVKNQTCKDFEWIVLFDSSTPEEYKKRIDNYQKLCPQFIPILVEPENGRYFARIFRDEVVKRLRAKRVITTYLDNDDALSIRFVEDLQNRMSEMADGTFIRYRDGYQYYTSHKYLMQVQYPRNHFVSVVECANPDTLKGIFGYGGHYHIDKMEGVKIENIKNLPLWCEVVHEKNMINDAYFLWGTKMIKGDEILRHDFAIDETIRSGFALYVFRFLPRYIKTFIRRTKYYLFGRKW